MSLKPIGPLISSLDLEDNFNFLNAEVNKKTSSLDFVNHKDKIKTDNPHGLKFRGALVVKTDIQSISNNALQIVSWSGTSYDTDNFFTSSNPTIITIPNGVSKIRLSAHTYWGVSSVGNRQVRFVKVGSTFSGGATQRKSAQDSIRSEDQIQSAIINVSAGDTFSVEVAQTSGGNLDFGGTATATWFQVEVIE